MMVDFFPILKQPDPIASNILFLFNDPKYNSNLQFVAKHYGHFFILNKYNNCSAYSLNVYTWKFIQFVEGECFIDIQYLLSTYEQLISHWNLAFFLDFLLQFR